MFAIIKAAGTQYKVEEGSVISLNKLVGQPGQNITFDEVLLVADNDNIKVGTPLVKGAKVTAQVVRHGKDKKIVVFKYRRRKNSSRKLGHRQPLTELKITGISL